MLSIPACAVEQQVADRCFQVIIRHNGQLGGVVYAVSCCHWVCAGTCLTLHVLLKRVAGSCLSRLARSQLQAACCLDGAGR